jgi:general secretion pathway protein D
MVQRKEVYPLFVSILESAGCSVIQDGEIYRVVSIPKRDVLVTPVVGPEEPTPAEGVVTKVIRLQNVSAGELRKVLESKVGGGKTGAIGAIEETNHLLITDTAESIRRIEKIVSEIDKPGLSKMTEVVPLEFAGAEDIASQLNQAMTDSDGRLPLGSAITQADELRMRLPSVPGGSTRATGRRNLVVVASPHSNSLILVGTQAQIAELKKIIKQMDVDSPSGRGRLNAVFLKYLAAEDAAKSISALLAKSEAKAGTAGAQRPKISIEASVANNALIVDATRGDFDVVKKLIEQLDHAPEQVHVEVKIWEVSTTDGLDLGVQLASLELPAKVGETVVQGSAQLTESANSLLDSIQNGIFPRGISVAVAHGSGVDASGNITADHPAFVTVDAVRKKARFKMLSETSLETQNNKEATVSIVNDIPILKSTIQGGSGTSRDVIQNIDRMDVGIKLKLTPHIIPGGEVQMVLSPSIEAVTDSGPSDTQFAPTIAKREVSTTVTVADGKTIIIAGLTREDKTKVVKKVPVLGSLPLVGFLFRSTSDATEKTDLLIYVTPRVVTAMAAAESVMKDWEQKTGLKTHEEK